MREYRPNHYERLLGMTPAPMLALLDTIQAADFIGFASSTVIQDMLGTAYERDYAGAQSSAQLLYHVWLMRKGGEKIFVLEPDMALMLAHTEIRGVTGNQLKTPYREQLFVLPPNLEFLTLYDPRTGHHRLSEIYVGFDGQELRIMAVGEANDNSIDHADDTFAYFRFNIDATDLRTQVRQQIEKNSKDAFLTLTGGVYNLDKAEKLFNFVMNILLYVCSPNAQLCPEIWADIEPRIRKLKDNARKEAIERLKNKNRFLKIRIGHLTKLNQEQRQWYRESTATRTLVMGHWMRYHTGTGRVNIELKWRQPFWRGVGEISNVPHLV